MSEDQRADEEEIRAAVDRWLGVFPELTQRVEAGDKTVIEELVRIGLAMRTLHDLRRISVTEAVRVEVSKLTLEAGDVLVVRSPEGWDPEQCRAMADGLQGFLAYYDHPNVPVLVSGTDISTLEIGDDLLKVLADRLAQGRIS